MAAVTQSNDGRRADSDEESSEPTTAPAPSRTGGTGGPRVATNAPGDGFFSIRKKGQGYWTRMGTAIGAAFIGVMTALELYQQIPTFLHGDPKHDSHVALAAALAFLAVYTLWAYWYTNKSSSVDFLIATDSEMKKVNWTTRRELIGSTKIVILFMFFIALFLFGCDLLFGAFFHLIGVLKAWF